MTGLFLFNFKTTHFKNHFDTNLVKIHQAVIEILSFSCSMLFLVTANGSHLGMPNCKNQNGLIQETFWHKVGSISSKCSSDMVIFLVTGILFLVMAPGSHLDSYISFYLILKHLKARIILTQIWSKSIKQLLKYCHFHVLCYL